MDRLKKLAKTHWWLGLRVLSVGLVLGWLFLFRLGSITGGLASQELQQQALAGSWHNLIGNPLNAPLTILEWLSLTIFGHSSAAMRLPSVILCLVGVGAFAYVLRRWYGTRTAWLGTVIFASSAWVLHVGRFASSPVVYLWATPVLLAVYIAWDRHQERRLTHYLAAITLAALLYVPGMFWLLLVSVGTQPHLLTQAWRKLATKPWQIGWVASFTVLLLPLLRALVVHAPLRVDWLGLPHVFAAPSEFFHHLLQLISFLFWNGPSRPELWLDQLPILSAFCMAMLVLGTIFYLQHWSAPRTRLLAGLFLIGGIFYVVGGSVDYSVVVPIVYLIIAGGVGYLLHLWLRVFPRNPVARAVGYGLIGVAIALSCTYNLRAYFVAWPHNQATATAFQPSPKTDIIPTK